MTSPTNGSHMKRELSGVEWRITCNGSRELKSNTEIIFVYYCRLLAQGMNFVNTANTVLN